MRPSSNSPSSPGRFLISGGAGFIGAAVTRALLERGHEVVVLDDLSAGRLDRLPGRGQAPGLTFVRGDVTRPDGWSAAFEHGPFQGVMHLAARVGVARVLADPESCRRANEDGVRSLITVLAGVSAADRPRVFAASTSEVYADRPGPLDEVAPLRSTQSLGRFAYAASKLRGEELLDSADLWSGPQRPVHLRFFNVVGPGQDAGSGMVLPTFVECARAGQPLPVHGDGQQRRTFSHVDDVGQRLAELVEREIPREAAEPVIEPGPLNIGGTARCSVLELAEAVARVAATLPEFPPVTIARVDPRRAVSEQFEDVLHREPCLDRAQAAGLAALGRDLDELVLDTLLRHPSSGATAPRPPAESPACASPAS